jgi:hypothetical protein
MDGGAQVDSGDSIMRIVRQVLDYQTLSRICSGRWSLGWPPYCLAHAGRGRLGQSKDALGRRKKAAESEDGKCC